MHGNKLERYITKTIAHIILIVAALAALIPFALIILASFTTESALIQYGYSLFPKEFSLDAYKVVMQSSGELVNAYIVTIFTTVVGTFLNVLVTIMAAYPMSRSDYKWQSKINFYFYFTMLFHGGAVPTYILISQYLHLKDNILVLIIPHLFSVWNCFLMRTYFKSTASSLWEAAEIDGAGQFRILFQIVVPTNVTGIATVTLFVLLGFWNQWYPCLMYMTRDKYITLQYFLSRVMSQISAMIKDAGVTAESMDLSDMPSETARMAMCVLAAGPMIFVFMFFQKYFTKGMNLGSVKG